MNGNGNGSSDRQPDLFPETVSRSGRGSGSAMAAMLRQRREVATEPAALHADVPQEAKAMDNPLTD